MRHCMLLGRKSHPDLAPDDVEQRERQTCSELLRHDCALLSQQNNIAGTLVRVILMSLLNVSGSRAKGLLVCVLGAGRELTTFAAT